MSSSILTDWIRFGMNGEKPTLNQNGQFFSGITLPAHVLALYRNSLGQAIRHWKKPYFVDPMTHVFLQDREMIYRSGTQKPKKSYEKLCEYAQNAEYYLSMKSMVVDELSHSEKIDFADTMAHLALQVQLDGVSVTGIPKRMKSLSRIQKYMDIEKDATGFPSPAFLVSPYFYFESVGSPTYVLWKQAVDFFEKKIAKQDTDLDIYRAVCTSEILLESAHDITALVHDLEGSDGVVLWINKFEKCGLDARKLEGFANLVRGLHDQGQKTVALYGGYLTALYYHFGLDGLSFGLNAGDSKEVQSYATGGGAPARYYDPNLHTFVTARNMLTYYSSSSKYAKHFKCKCNVCLPISTALKSEQTNFAIHLSKMFKISKGKIKANWGGKRRHYINVRHSELRDIATHNLHILGQQATKTLSQFSGFNDEKLETLRCAVELSKLAP